MIKPGIVIALVVLVAVLGAALFLVQGDRPKPTTVSAEGHNLLKDFNSDSINSISITKSVVAAEKKDAAPVEKKESAPTEKKDAAAEKKDAPAKKVEKKEEPAAEKKTVVSVELKKKDKSWILTSHKDRGAKQDRVDKLLEDIKSATTIGVRPGKREMFALDPAHRTEVTLTRETGTTVLYLGKSPDYTSSFVNLEDNGAIYEVDKDLGQDAGLRTEKDERVLDPSWFYDLKIIGATADDIIDIAIKKGNEVTRVQRVIPGKGPVQAKQELGKDDPKPVWWLTEPEGMAANESTANSMASTAAYLNAKSFADDVPEKEQGFDKPAAKVVLRLKDGTEQTLTFGKISGDDVMLSVAGKPDPYKVYKYVYDTLTKTDDLKKKEEEKKDESKAEEQKEPTKPLPLPVKPAEVKKPEIKPAVPAPKAETAKPAPAAPAPAKKDEAKKDEAKKDNKYTLPAAPPPAPSTAKIEEQPKPVIPPAVNPPEQKLEEKK